MEQVNVYAETMNNIEDDSQSSDEEILDRDVENLNITEAAANMNYIMSGSKVLEDPDTITWENYKELFSEETAKLVENIHALRGSAFKLRQCQEVALHALGQKKNLFLVIGTGVGKTISYVYGIDLLRLVTGVKNGVGLVTAPLSVILTQKMTDNPSEVVVLSMAGKLKSSQDNQDAELSGGLEEEVLNGKYKLIIGHPESWSTEMGQRILETLKRRKLAILLAIDEFHKMLPKHWGTIRPEMADTVRRLRAFLVKGCPTVCLSATATKDEIHATSEILGFREPALILSSSPVQSQFKLVTVKSPSASTPCDGYTDSSGCFKPGFLNLFIRIYGKEFVDKVKQGRSHILRRCFMFFRTDSQLLIVYNYLREELGDQNFRTAPFVMFTSSTIGQSALVITARAPEVPLILTTQRLEMGWHMPGNDIIIFARPPDTLHSVIQGMGRAGRPQSDMTGYRRKALIYLLWNSYDLNSSKDMDEVVKEVNEHVVRAIKEVLDSLGISEHWGDLDIQKIVASVTPASLVTEHDMLSSGFPNKYKQHSSDLLGEQKREVIRQHVAEIATFSSDRSKINDFMVKPRGSPFHGLTKAAVNRFLSRNLSNFYRNFPRTKTKS